MSITLTEAAIAYAEAGMAVFRLSPRDKKPPAGSNGFKDAVTDPRQVERLWRGPPYNIGIATGEVSGFWVLDEDGPDGAASMAALEAAHGALPVTPEQSTGKGRHRLFALPADREVRNSAGKLGKGVDTRGNGGYIVAAPSIHPSGRAYAWAEGRSPWQVAFAPAPAWLLDLVAPIAGAPAPAAPRPVAPRARDGRASRYGEKALDNACREISTAPAGRQNDTLYDKSCAIGRLVAGGEIQAGYARAALVDAGLAMPAAGKPWARKQIEDMVDRALAWAASHPKAAPALDRTGSRQAGPAAVKAGPAPAAEVAAHLVEARRLWAEGRPPWSAATAAWLAAHQLEPRPDCAPALIEAFRFHPRAPWGRGREGPALLAPLEVRPGAPDALAVLPLHPACARFAHFVGESAGRAVLLGDWADPDTPLLVSIDLQDAWALVQGGFCGRVAVVPRLSSFAGGALGDAFGRVDPMSPRADPAQPAWTLPHVPRVVLAVRRDLRSPPLRVRGPGGRSASVRLEGQEAAQFFGSLAEQHWRAARPDLPANAVRAITARGAAGFHTIQQGEAAA